MLKFFVALCISVLVSASPAASGTKPISKVQASGRYAASINVLSLTSSTISYQVQQTKGSSVQLYVEVHCNMANGEPAATYWSWFISGGASPNIPTSEFGTPSYCDAYVWVQPSFLKPISQVLRTYV